MFVRLRWFVLGALSSMGVTVWSMTRLAELRRRLTPRALAESAANAGASGLRSAAAALREEDAHA